MVEILKNQVMWTFVVALFGGFMGAMITVWSQRSLASIERKRERIHAQLTYLYGPIYYYVHQNKKLFEINKKIMEAYDKEFIGKTWSPDANAQKNLNGTTLELANSYVDEVVKNNEKIKESLDKCFGLCDPADIESFSLFYEHYIRYKIELDESGKLETPMQIYKYVGDISFMRPEFMEKMEKRCEAKQKEYLKLTS